LLLERETIDGADLAAIAGMPARLRGPKLVLAPQAVAMAPVEIESNADARGAPTAAGTQPGTAPTRSAL